MPGPEEQCVTQPANERRDDKPRQISQKQVYEQSSTSNGHDNSKESEAPALKQTT